MRRTGPDMDFEKEIQELEAKLRRSPASFSTAELKKLYEGVGIVLEQKYGISPGHNPCSVQVITDAVLKMASEIKPCSILNVGIGGYPLLDMELGKKGFRVTGVEYAFSLASLARRASTGAGHPLPVIVGDGQQLPFSSQSFEACICSETLEHLPGDRRVVSEIHRVLKPGGYFLMTVPNLWELRGQKDRLEAYMKTKRWISHSSHLREYTLFSAKRLVRDLFSIEQWVPVGFTSENFKKMPVENFLSRIVHIPAFKCFSLSIALLLRKKE